MLRRLSAMLPAVVLTAALVVLVAYGLQLRPSGSTAVGPLSASPTPNSSGAVNAYVLGDALAIATGDGQDWPQRVAADQQWDVVVDAVAGSGFVAGAETRASFINRVSAVVEAQPDVVLVQGGVDDVKVQPRLVEAAATAVLVAIKRGLPEARVALVGPVTAASPPPARLAQTNSALAAAARTASVPFFDGLAQAWFAGRSVDLGDTGTAPTAAGHELLAARIEEALFRSSRMGSP